MHENPREELLDFIKAYIIKHQYPPTVREMAEGMGYYSTSTVYSHLQKLFIDGRIETDAADGSPRAIRVVGLSVIETGTSNHNIHKSLSTK